MRMPVLQYRGPLELAFERIEVKPLGASAVPDQEAAIPRPGFRVACLVVFPGVGAVLKVLVAISEVLKPKVSSRRW